MPRVSKKAAEKPAKKVVEKKGRAKKGKKDPNEPKKPLTAFLLFSQEMRSQIKEDKPDLTFGEVGKELGRLWKDLTDKEKEKFKLMENKGKAEYEGRLKAYQSKAAPAEDDDDEEGDDDDDE